MEDDIIGNKWIVKTTTRDGYECYIYVTMHENTDKIKEYWTRNQEEWRNARGHGVHWGRKCREWTANFGSCDTRNEY